MVKLAVVGAGMMAKAALKVLLDQPDVETVFLGDLDVRISRALAEHYNDQRVRSVYVNALDPVVPKDWDLPDLYFADE